MDDFFETDPEGSEPPVETREERPKRISKPRAAVHPAERRRLMIRRGVAVGVGVLIFILIVFGIRGCLDARSDRALDEYASNVTQLVDETNTLGKTTFDTISDPGDLSVTDFTGEIETDRNAMDGFLTRVEKLDVPGDMKDAQSSLRLAYQLRSDAMGVIASKMPTALGDEGSEKAISQIAAQIGVLNSADVIFNRVTRHKVDGVIASAGAGTPELPRGAFVPNPRFWTDPANVADALAGVSGATPEVDDGSIRGTGISTVAIGGVALAEDAPNTVPTGTDPTVEVSVQNQGESEETDIQVTVTVDGGGGGEGTIPALAVGETGVATVTLSPAPTGQVTLTVSVAPVDGEGLTDNNEKTYTVTFE